MCHVAHGNRCCQRTIMRAIYRGATWICESFGICSPNVSLNSGTTCRWVTNSLLTNSHVRCHHHWGVFWDIFAKGQPNFWYPRLTNSYRAVAVFAYISHITYSGTTCRWVTNPHLTNSHVRRHQHTKEWWDTSRKVNLISRTHVSRTHIVTVFECESRTIYMSVYVYIYTNVYVYLYKCAYTYIHVIYIYTCYIPWDYMSRTHIVAVFAHMSHKQCMWV